LSNKDKSLLLPFAYSIYATVLAHEFQHVVLCLQFTHCSETALLDMHHFMCGISSTFHHPHSVHCAPVHLFLHISPHHSHHLRSRHLSLQT